MIDIFRIRIDGNCPECCFPELTQVVDFRKEEPVPLWVQCGSRNCDWGRKILPLKKKTQVKKRAK